MSCRLPQSEASGGAPLSRSSRLTEVGVTRGCLYGTSHLCSQSTRRHIGLHHSFLDREDFLGGNCSGSNPGFFRHQSRPSPCLLGRFSHSLWAPAVLKQPVIATESCPIRVRGRSIARSCGFHSDSRLAILPMNSPRGNSRQCADLPQTPGIANCIRGVGLSVFFVGIGLSSDGDSHDRLTS